MSVTNKSLAQRCDRPSGPAIQPWYGLTEIDDQLADMLHYRWHEQAYGRVYDLHFSYRTRTIATLGDLSVSAVQHAVGHANAWLIATSPTEAGVLKDSTLAGAYGLSPKEMRRRNKFLVGGERGHKRSQSPPEPLAVDGTDGRRMAIMRTIVEDAAHQLLIANVANPTARTQVMIAISRELDAHAQAGRLAIRNPEVLWQAPPARLGQ